MTGADRRSSPVRYEIHCHGEGCDVVFTARAPHAKYCCDCKADRRRAADRERKKVWFRSLMAIEENRLERNRKKREQYRKKQSKAFLDIREDLVRAAENGDWEEHRRLMDLL